MKITLNTDKEIVKTIKDGLKKQAATAPAELKKQMIINVCAKNSKSR